MPAIMADALNLKPAPSPPLSEAETEEIQDALLWLDSDGAMTFEVLEGFLAGLILCPERLEPSRWLPEIWGGADGISLLGSLTQYARIVSLIHRHRAWVEFTLSGPEGY
jgi:uncharacterized protein